MNAKPKPPEFPDLDQLFRVTAQGILVYASLTVQKGVSGHLSEKEAKAFADAATGVASALAAAASYSPPL